MEPTLNNWHSAKHLLIGLCILAIGTLTACHKTQPQNPSYRSGKTTSETDSSLLQAIETNQHLAEEADRALSTFVSEGYAQQELGYWTKGMYAVDRPLQAGEQATVSLQVYSLGGELLLETTEQVTVGKTQMIQAVEDALLQMERPQTVSLLVPWYLAYGTTGTDRVPPYTNVRIELSVQ